MDGGGKVTVFQIQKDTVVTIYNLVIEHGKGGIVNYGTLTLVNVAIVHNQANKNFVAGIENYAILRLFNSTVAFNTSGSVGAIYNRRELQIYNSTVALNVSLVDDYQSTGGILEGNCCGDWADEITIMSSIVTGNSAGFSSSDLRGVNGAFDLFSQGHNILGTVKGEIHDYATSDQILVDPKFVPFTVSKDKDTNYYLALAPDSPAIGNGKCDITPIVKYDQLGQPRKMPCDVGAVELGDQ